MGLAAEPDRTRAGRLGEELRGLTDRKYTFKVHPDAHKTQIRQAVEALFDVKVERVNVLKVQAKPKRRGLIKGTRPGWKKAVVLLREGETIEVFEGAPSDGPEEVQADEPRVAAS